MTTPGDDVRRAWRRANRLRNYDGRGDFSDCPCLVFGERWHDFAWNRVEAASMALDGLSIREVTSCE